MATWWMKSLQCKSRALDDVVQHKEKLTGGKPDPNRHHSSAGCRKSVKDVVEGKPRKQKSSPENNFHSPVATAERTKRVAKRSVSRKPEPVSRPLPQTAVHGGSGGTRASRAAAALTELPQGHPSRNVVEIIFHSSWGRVGEKEFSGRVEMVFKVQNLPRTVTRFEEYRESVISRATNSGTLAEERSGEEDARCVADGNEVMRFYCLGPTSSASGGAYDPNGCAWAFSGFKGPAICTFSGSGGAHDSAGGGKGRRAMLVCRVIAGRVCKQLGFDSLLEGTKCGYDSVSGENSELLVFDSRAVLPCFLIIYRL